MEARFNTDQILLVEDEENDVFLLKRAFQAAAVPNPIYVARDGEEAIAYLTSQAPLAGTSKPLPALILLDLKMPRLDGFDFLRWLRSRSTMPYLPVLMISSSALEKDVRQAYSLGINAFISKPHASEDRKALVKAINDFWLRFVELPPP